MLDLLTIGRPFDDALIINAASPMCCECDPDKADRREYQARLNEKHGLEASQLGKVLWLGGSD